MNKNRCRHLRQIAITAERSVRVTWLTVAVLAAVWIFSGEAALAADLTPTESVRSTITEVVKILDDADLRQPVRAAERRQQIERVVKDRVSYEEMGKRALGMPWNELTEDERKEFVSLFVQLLRDTFAGRIDAYAGQQVAYLSEQLEEGYAEVKAKLTGSKTDTLLDFRLADRSGIWLVYDVVIDGASVVGNYHAQFTSIMRDLSYAGLISRMKERTLLVKTFETGTDR